MDEPDEPDLHSDATTGYGSIPISLRGGIRSMDVHLGVLFFIC